VNFNPTNTLLLQTFRAIYSVPTNIAIVGPYGGKLDNSDESIELYKPDAPDANGTPYILVERVHYRSTLPWDPLADGFGPSSSAAMSALTATIRRIGSRHIDAGRAVRSQPRPCHHAATAEPHSGGSLDREPLDHCDGLWPWLPMEVQRRAIAWRHCADVVVDQHPITQSGSYAVLVFNSGGTALSSNATVTVRALPIITQQPQNVRTIQASTQRSVSPPRRRARPAISGVSMAPIFQVRRFLVDR
jgi:hypothetical protein